MILTTCVIKNNATFYPQIFLEKALYSEKTLKKDKWRINSMTSQKMVEFLYVRR